MDELLELIDNTTQTFIDLDSNEYSKEQSENGAIESGKLKGVRFTGSNGNSIFIPAAGWCNTFLLSSAGISGSLWSSSLIYGYGDNDIVSMLHFTCDGYISDYTDGRCYGNSVRGVQP